MGSLGLKARRTVSGFERLGLEVVANLERMSDVEPENITSDMACLRKKNVSKQGSPTEIHACPTISLLLSLSMQRVTAGKLCELGTEVHQS